MRSIDWRSLAQQRGTSPLFVRVITAVITLTCNYSVITPPILFCCCVIPRLYVASTPPPRAAREFPYHTKRYCLPPPPLREAVTPRDTGMSVCGSGTSMPVSGVCTDQQQIHGGGGGGGGAFRQDSVLEGVLACHPAEGQHVGTFQPFPRGVVYGAYP